ncbi:MAG: helix-turn-helix transcriptional regulator [Alphaproteobacteria bacterium]|nr:helix-turn-helix transcriptional regulator [Alphaproteobacteria bacterium]
MSETRTDSPGAARRQSVRAFKKSVILDAAQRTLDRDGIEGATMRAIAKEAGYTPGALYAYYPNKDDVLAGLLCRSLGRVSRTIRHAMKKRGRGPADPVELASLLSAHYRRETGEFDLLLTVLQSRRINHLSPGMARTLNGRLIAALSPIAEALGAAGRWKARPAGEATTQAAGLALGILLLENSGRLSALEMDGVSLTAGGFATLLSREPPSTSSKAGGAATGDIGAMK